MQYSVFAVDETPYCVWEYDLRERNLRFVESIDYRYFEYLAATHGGNLEGEDRQRAAIALRTAYHHALETLFSLLCAAAQAPGCVVGWIQKCSSGQLRSLVRKIQEGRHHLYNRIGRSAITWRALSETINLFSYEDQTRTTETQRLYAILWERFAADFLDDYHIKEYNSIKHGFRARSGGFTLAAGIEHEYGVPPPNNEMQVVGGSEFGTSFYAAAPIEGAPQIKRDPHFRVRSYAINWRPEALIAGLQLAALSIGNVISRVKIWHGVDARTVQFTRPEDSAVFDEPWRYGVGVMRMNMDTIISEADIRRCSADQLRADLQRSIGHSAT
jgi:hypothetical protein